MSPLTESVVLDGFWRTLKSVVRRKRISPLAWPLNSGGAINRSTQLDEAEEGNEAEDCQGRGPRLPGGGGTVGLLVDGRWGRVGLFVLALYVYPELVAVRFHSFPQQ